MLWFYEVTCIPIVALIVLYLYDLFRLRETRRPAGSELLDLRYRKAS